MSQNTSDFHFRPVVLFHYLGGEILQAEGSLQHGLLHTQVGLESGSHHGHWLGRKAEVRKWPAQQCRTCLTCAFFLSLFFDWRKIALQCYVSFCHITMRINHNYMYILPFLGLPLVLPSLPSRSSQSSRLGSLCYIATSHHYFPHFSVYM